MAISLKILILDDDKYRHKIFQSRLIGNDVWHSYTVEHASQILSHQGPFDILYLDHDLNDHHTKSFIQGPYGPQPATGFDLVKFIMGGLAPQKRPSQVIIHSYNKEGAQMMCQALQAAGIPAALEPFDPGPPTEGKS